MSFHDLESHRGIDQEPDFQERRAEFYVNIALSRIFIQGAAITAKGVAAYPCPFQKPDNLPTVAIAAQFEAGNIFTITPEEADIPVKDSAHPPQVFIIPAGAQERLVTKKSTIKRVKTSFVGLLTGFNEDGAPIINYFLSGNVSLEEGLKAVAQKEMEDRKLDNSKIKTPTLTLVKNALRQMSVTMGLGDLDDYVLKLKRNAEYK